MPLPDGRTVTVLADEAAVNAKICETVTDLAKAAIASKGSFSLGIPSGSVVNALGGLSKADADWSNMHVFYVGERLGAAKNKHTGAMDTFGTHLGSQHCTHDVC